MACAVWLLAILLAWSAPAAANVGFTHLSIPEQAGPPLEAGIWYPTNATPSEQDIALFTQTVAPDAPVAGTAHGLIVISHGNGGDFASHYDTALALAHAGFVVIAMTHTGDNWRDQTHATDLPLRPRAVRAAIDYALAAWPGRAAIDPHRIGIFGFSAGGFTALVSAGGIPALSRVPPYCATHATTYVCGVRRAHPPYPAHPVVASDWVAEPRLRAAVIAAPAIGFTFDRAGLARVRLPVQLWRAGSDHILPSPDNVEPVRDALPRPPEYHVEAGADHFDFLAPCSDSLAQAVPDICKETGGFDRAAFHARFNRAVVRFFQRSLSVGRAPGRALMRAS